MARDLKFVEAQRQVAERGHDLGGTPVPDPALIFVERNIAAVMGAVFHRPPMAADHFGERHRRGFTHRPTARIEGNLYLGLGVNTQLLALAADRQKLPAPHQPRLFRRYGQRDRRPTFQPAVLLLPALRIQWGENPAVGAGSLRFG